MRPAEPSGLASGRGNRSPNLGASAQPVEAANCGEPGVALLADLGVRARRMHAARDVARLIGPVGGEPNLPNGSIFTSNGNNFKASYTGGTGNDLTLKVVP